MKRYYLAMLFLPLVLTGCWSEEEKKPAETTQVSTSKAPVEATTAPSTEQPETDEKAVETTQVSMSEAPAETTASASTEQSKTGEKPTTAPVCEETDAPAPKPVRETGIELPFEPYVDKD